MELTFKIAVCDDEELFLKKLTTQLNYIMSHLECKYDVTEFYDGKELLLYCKRNPVDIILADIDMPEMNGFNAAAEIQKYKPDIPIVFITAHEEYAFQAYSYQPFWFVSKLDMDMLDEVMEKLIKTLRCRRYIDSIFPLKIDDKIYNINVKEIIYFKSDRHYIKAFDINGVAAHYRCGIRDAYAQLSNSGYIYANRSYIINCRYIEQFGAQYILLNNKERIKVTRNTSMLNEAQQLYGKFMRSLRW